MNMAATNNVTLAETAAAPAVARQGRRRWLLLVAPLVLAVAASGWALLGRHRPLRAAPPATPPVVLQLDSFIVNLADADQMTYLRLAVALAVKPSGGGKEHDEASGLKPLVPEIRDTILSVVTQWRSDQLLAPGGKEHLKQSLLAALHQRLPQLDLQDVYFTDFLVQR